MPIFVIHRAYDFTPLLLHPFPSSSQEQGRLGPACSWPRGGGGRRLALFTLVVSPCNLGNRVANRQHGGASHAAIHNANLFIFHTIGYLSHPMPCQGDCALFVLMFSAGVSGPAPSFTPAYVLTLACCSWTRALVFVLFFKTNESIMAV